MNATGGPEKAVTTPDAARTTTTFRSISLTAAAALVEAAVAHRPRLVAIGGGYPIVEEGQVIGGLGLSGGTAEQDAVAAGIGCAPDSPDHAAPVAGGPKIRVQ